MKKPIIKLDRIRLLAALAGVGLIIAGCIGKLDWGTFCSYCPMGFLGATVASKAFHPQMLLPVLLVLIAAIVLGRIFCAWLCPTALLRGIFKGENASQINSGRCNGQCQSCSDAAACSDTSAEGKSYTPYAILGGALLASFIFGFPVFCLFCPVGLFFGFIFAIYRVSAIYQPGWELVIFPIILALEVFVLKSWCTKFCPMGLIFNLLGRLGSITNVVRRPVVNQDVCLSEKGYHCNICKNVCPEHIDLPQTEKLALNDCTLCLECYSNCPVKAIEIK